MTSSENKYEIANYAIAESAAIRQPVDGHLACSTCRGCGMVPSTDPLTDKAYPSDSKRTVSFKKRGNHKHWLVPVRIGVDLCPSCKGDGHQRRLEGESREEFERDSYGSNRSGRLGRITGLQSAQDPWTD